MDRIRQFRRAVALLALALAACAGKGGAEAGFTCDPGRIRAEPSGDAVVIAGSLRTPTPGYSYRLEPSRRSQAVRHFKLTLTAPDGLVAQVISALEIEERLELSGGIEKIRIAVDKPFNWGPERIVCTRAQD